MRANETLTVKNGDSTIELTPQVIDALRQVMRATCAMMREREPEFADCWEWGRCEIEDWSKAGGILFFYGGAGDEIDDQAERFVVAVGEAGP